MNRLLTLKILSLTAIVIIPFSKIIDLYFEWNGNVSMYLPWMFSGGPGPENGFWGLATVFTIMTFVSCVIIFVMLISDNFRAVKFLAPVPLLTYLIAGLFRVFHFRSSLFGWGESGLSTAIRDNFIGYSVQRVSSFDAFATTVNTHLSGVVTYLVLLALVIIVYTGKRDTSVS